MDVQTFPISDLVLLKPRIFNDDRGYFFESFNEEQFQNAIGQNIHFIQDNFSESKKDVLRGLHFQIPPHAQDKLVRVALGSVIDIAVDLRKNSPTYGQYQAVELSDQNHHSFFIPKGFAHGFVAISDIVRFEYKVTDYWYPESEGGIRYDDPSLNIDWGTEHSIMNQKDLDLPLLKDFETPFV